MNVRHETNEMDCQCELKCVIAHEVMERIKQRINHTTPKHTMHVRQHHTYKAPEESPPRSRPRLTDASERRADGGWV